MATIITATDFSEVAENAVHYACSLARDTGASVVVVHSFFIPVTFNDTPMPVMPIDEGKQIAEERMAELIASLAGEFPGVSIKAKVTYGDIIDSLEEYTTDIIPDVIVVGNSTTGDSALWMGSNVLGALRNLPYPVIAVPPDAAYKKVEKICFATDLKHLSDNWPAQQLLNIAGITGAQVHVLNVAHEDPQTGTETPKEANLIEEKIGNMQPQYHYVDSPDTDEAIQRFVEANHMDWLVIIPHKHSFFEGLFHKSHTKALIKTSHLPLVALHEL